MTFCLKKSAHRCTIIYDRTVKGEWTMKKFLTCVFAAFLAVSASGITPCSNRVFAMTVVDDAETAVSKNVAAFKSAFDKAEITNDFTRDDLENMIFEACEYSSSKDVGAGFILDSFKLKKATNAKAGYVKATIIIYLDDAEDGFEVEKAIAPLGGTDPEEDGDATVGAEDKTEVKQTPTVEISASDAKKELQAAYSAINSAMFDFEVSNDTKLKDIIAMAKKAIPSGSHVTIDTDECSIDIVKASTTVNGTLSATVTLVCAAETKGCSLGKTIEPIVTENSAKIDEDRSAVGKALDRLTYTNRSTKEEMLEVAEAAVKNGTKLSWKSFVKNNATFKSDGEIIAYMTFTLAEETRETRFHFKMKMLVRNIPRDKISVNKEEWEILRITNVERHKVGDKLLTMVDALQKACDIREPELAESFSHTRPNGKAPFTAITDFNYSTAGENIYMCPAPGRAVSGEQAMKAWMNSDGHRENLLKSGYNYIGAGAYDNDKVGTALQLFAGVKCSITSIVTASGKTDYIDEDEMQKDYLICTADNGIVSYVPLDIDYMTADNGVYTLNLYSDVPFALTVGGKGGKSSTPSVTVPKNTDNGGETAQGGTAKFSDVRSGDYFANAVDWAVNKGITTGTTATTFSPNDTCTRAQILTFLWRAVGSPKSDTANPFSDVRADDYYYYAALWASEKGMVTASLFEGDTPCTRSSTVTYMWQNAGSPGSSAESKFTDVSASAAYARAVAWAVENSVTSGTSDTTFSPDEICSRGQIVTFLNRALD